MVNSDGVTFLDGKERLKLVDTLTRPDGMKIFLEDSKLKVYDYTDGTKGEELGLDEYSYTYEEKEGENVLTFHLPDGRPLLVEYVYRGDGEVNKTFTLTNHAVLSGTSSQGTSSGSDNRNLLQTGVAYRMVELEAPHGYELRMEPFDFYIDTEPANTPKDYAGQLCFRDHVLG